jgi:CRP-like cAMP-binding protein
MGVEENRPPLTCPPRLGRTTQAKSKRAAAQLPLTAVAAVQSDIVHVPREEFLQLMHERPDFCREAADMLGRELTFIQSALAERCRQMPKRASNNPTP